MSERDRAFLEKAGLKISAAAKILSVRPQAVSQGIQRASDYLTGERLSKLFKHVIEKAPQLSEELGDYIEDKSISNYSDLKGTQLGIEKLKVIGSTEHYNISSLWIFSALPLELSNSKRLKEVEEEYFSNPALSIVYFVPPRVSLSLRGVLTNVLRRLLQRRSGEGPAAIAHVEIVECPAVDIAPHFSIANPAPSSDGRAPFGVVLIGEDDVLAPIPQKQVRNILNVLYANGIGVDAAEVAPRSLSEGGAAAEWGGLQFRSIFSSRDLVAEDEQRRKQNTS